MTLTSFLRFTLVAVVFEDFTLITPDASSKLDATLTVTAATSLGCATTRVGPLSFHDLSLGLNADRFLYFCNFCGLDFFLNIVGC